MLFYFNEIVSNGIIYSVDNVRITFSIFPIYLNDFNHYLTNLYRMDISQYGVNTNAFKYRNMFSIKYTNSTMTIGFGFNTASGDKKYYGFLEFNPNKVGADEQFQNDIKYIKSVCRTFYIDRFDLAIDIPTERKNVYLQKDKRKYQLVYNSSDNQTEYLGCRSTVGFVKLYNKSIESDLDYPLTRLELTVAPTLANITNTLPNLYVFMPQQFNLETLQAFNDLNVTERVIIDMFYELVRNYHHNGLVFFNSLGRKERKKLKPFLLPESSLCLFDTSAIVNLLSALTTWLR